MQCKDIPDDEFLDAVRVAAALRGRTSAMIWDVRHVLSGFPELVSDQYMPAGDDHLPYKLVLAKARKLIFKQKMDGCYCGCRGDFEVNEEPINELQNAVVIDFFTGQVRHRERLNNPFLYRLD